MKKTRTHSDRSRTGINRALSTTAAVLLLSAAAFQANAGVTLTNTNSTTAPSAGAGFQNLDFSGTATGSDYSDQGGLGQSFTLAPGFDYMVNSYSLMFDGDAPAGLPMFTGNWNAQIVRYDNIHSGGFADRNDPINGPYSAEHLANPLVMQQYFGFAGPGAIPTVGDWVTLSFTAGDVLTLQGGYTYGIVLSSATGWSRWKVGSTDTVANAERFRAYGGPNFNDQYVNFSSDNDRTFVLNLTATPEPTTAALLGGMGLIALARRRS